ncbi:MAG: bifunctional riboflavin kinase/FAD synthetase [Chloroflexota bacterium]
MFHFNSLDEVQSAQPTRLTIGAFDGVHRGHQRILKNLSKAAQNDGMRAAALTFFPLPKRVLKETQPRYYITSPDRRAELLLQNGVSLVITHPFNNEVRQIRALDFVKQLTERLDLKELWVGPDFALGYRREGDVRFLRRVGAKLGFQVHIVDFFTADGEIVSSSRIRAALRAGDVGEAHRYLGRPFKLEGSVVHGDHRGMTMGYPTANLSIWEEQILPENGVYVAIAQVQGKKYGAAVNIGTRPTVTADSPLTVEAHLIDFEGDIYGESLSLDFYARLRDEKRYASIDQLCRQLRLDVQNARAVLRAESGSSSSVTR